MIADRNTNACVEAGLCVRKFETSTFGKPVFPQNLRVTDIFERQLITNHGRTRVGEDIRTRRRCLRANTQSRRESLLRPSYFAEGFRLRKRKSIRPRYFLRHNVRERSIRSSPCSVTVCGFCSCGSDSRISYPTTMFKNEKRRS